jgi:hypothetical protein
MHFVTFFIEGQNFVLSGVTMQNCSGTALSISGANAQISNCNFIFNSVSVNANGATNFSFIDSLVSDSIMSLSTLPLFSPLPLSPPPSGVLCAVRCAARCVLRAVLLWVLCVFCARPLLCSVVSSPLFQINQFYQTKAVQLQSPIALKHGSQTSHSRGT